MDRMLLYTSTRASQPEHHGHEIEAIVAIARARNLALNVTGALIATDTYFAQILEGRPRTLDEVMGSIRRDPRHCDVRVQREADIVRRQFEPWSLAYSGSSRHFEQFIAPLTAAAYTPPGDIDRLIDLIERLARPKQDPVFRRP